MEGFFSSGGGDSAEDAAERAAAGGGRARRYYRKTLRPSAAQLASLGLKTGINTISFSVHSSLQGTQSVASRIFVFETNAKLVISDVDGTITKSDVLGHLMPRVGYDWSHLGVTSLYSRITANGYQMIYLTARGIGMATTTRDYLASIQQGEPSKEESKLPEGPCLLSPSGLIESLTREVILKRPEDFKIACLQDVRSLWPPSHNPFYAGFGNRDSDVLSYRESGVPPSRILVINPQGEIRIGGQTYCWASYPKLVQLSNEMFPSLDAADQEQTAADEDFSAFNFWRVPPPPLTPDVDGDDPTPAAARSPTSKPLRASPTFGLRGAALLEDDDCPSVDGMDD